MKLVRQEQCFSWKKFRLPGWEEGTYHLLFLFLEGEKNCRSLPHRASERKWLAFLPVLIIYLLFLLRHSGTFWATRVNRAYPPHTLAPWQMACLPYFSILGLTCSHLLGSVGKLSNLSPQLLHFHQKECDLFPTKENWDSNCFLTGI